MKYTDYIRRELSQLRDKTAQEDLFRIMDHIDEDGMVFLASMVGKWSRKCCECHNLRNKVNNLERKIDRLNKK